MIVGTSIKKIALVFFISSLLLDIIKNSLIIVLFRYFGKILP